MSAKLQIDPDYRSMLHFNRSGMIKVAFARVSVRKGDRFRVHVRACPSVRCRRTYLAIDLSRCRRAAINRKSRNNEAVDCRAPAVYIDVCVGSDDVMRVETRGEEGETGESDKREGDLTRLSSDGRTIDLLTPGIYDVGQSDSVPPILKRKLYIGYFIRAKHWSRTSSAVQAQRTFWIKWDGYTSTPL